MMTRKDFELIANALSATQPERHWSANKHAQYKSTCRRMAAELEFSNPRFDRERFLDACGFDMYDEYGAVKEF